VRGRTGVSPVMSGRLAKQRRMAKRKIEALESYLSGDSTVVPLISSMGLREVNEQMVRMKLAQLSQRVLP
jgi:hypothetical protein